MKLFNTAITFFLLALMINSRVLLNRHRRHSQKTNLFTSYPRYLVPNPMKELLEGIPTESQSNKLRLDNKGPKERKLFMTTDFEAQKTRFNQRMNCKFIKNL